MNRSLKLARPTAGIAAAVLAVGLLASCSSNADSTASPASTTASSPATSSAAPPSAATSSTEESAPAASTTTETQAAASPASADDAAITETAKAYLAALSSGNVAQLSSVLCKKLVDTIPPGTTDSPAQPQPLVLEKIENIVITGDNATADVTANLQGGSDIGPQTSPVKFVNENGWKACE